MQYFVLALVAGFFLLFIFKVLRPTQEPDFKLKGAANSEKLGFLIAGLGARSKKFEKRGVGLSVRLMKKYIIKAYKVIADKAQAGEECLEFEHWIYDNFYKIIEILGELEKQKVASCNLPHVGELPRLYELISLVIKSNDGFIDSELLEYAVSVYNNETPLIFSEISAIKYMVKYCILEYVSIFCAKAVKINHMIYSGLEDSKNGNPNINLIKFNSYVYGCSLSLEEVNKTNFAELCANNGNDMLTRIDNFFMSVSKYNGMLKSSISTLHSLYDWCDDEYILKLSPINEFFSAEHSSSYELNSLATKYLLCGNIARLAKKQKSSEMSVCREVIFKSRNNNKDIANYILPPPKGKSGMSMYVVAVLLTPLFFGVIYSIIFKGYYWIYALIAIPIFIAFSCMIAGTILKIAFKSRSLPSRDLKKLDGINCRTAICVPRLVASVAEIAEAFANMQTIMQANFNSIFSYCLLLDFPKSDKEEGEDYDEEFLQCVKKSYDECLDKERVCVVVRERKKVAGKDYYQGWEKKRGALLELNKYILKGENDFKLLLGEVKNAKYIITLDSDTLINSCEKLVEIMEHPYNADKAVVGINMTSTPCSRNKTAFSKIFAGGSGLNNYTNFLSESEHDIFAVGNFTGKGIYRVREFDGKVGNAFLENRILSHDYIEGAWAGTANSNVYALDNFPSSYPQFLARELRWLRGDWQLLPFLFPIVKNAEGKRVKNILPLIAKWHIFCNLVYSFLPITSVVLLLTSFWAASPIAVILLALSLNIIKAFMSLRHLLYKPKICAKAVVRELFYIAVLPTLAVCYSYAIVITLVRIITRKNLLEWRVFAHGDASVSFIPNAVAAIIFTATTLIFSLGWGYYLLSFIFLGGIVLNKILSLSLKKYNTFDNEELKAFLTDTAKNTLEYFKIIAGEEFNYLPCDNYQEQNNVGFAVRTSPTNIGMLIMAYISALELNLITQDALNLKIEKVISSVEKLEKWKGNLYNWIDVKTLEPLCPRYVSAVDSGNFLACLMTASAYSGGKLKNRIDTLIKQTDLGALFDERRGLFFTGFNADSMAFDRSHYDLMGSESALTYLVAVGNNKVSKTAWDNLSRQTVKYRGDMLYSWTGGMFEYLMSRLFFSFEYGTLMDETAKNVARSHVFYAKERDLPIWGISECQNSDTDDCGNFQYKAYGVPQIAHSNIADTDLVAPYASFLALNYQPQHVLKNFKAMCDAGAFGKLGFYESLNATNFNVQKTYMTHHQGMLLTAIANYLTDDSITRKIQTLPTARAASLLLSQVDRMKAKRKLRAFTSLKNTTAAPIFVSGRTLHPYLNLLTNGKYKLVTTSSGGGYCVYDNTFITRFHGDSGVNEESGIGIFAEIDGKKHKLLSGNFTANADSTIYQMNNSQFACKNTVCVLPNMDGHAIKTEFTYIGEDSAEILLSSYGEIALNSLSGDMSHPAYSKMFIETGIDDSKSFMWAKRNGENVFYAAHFLLPQTKLNSSDKKIAEYEGNRSNLSERVKRKEISFGRVLDPVFCAKFKVTVNKGEKIQFETFTLAAHSYEKLKSMVKFASSSGFLSRCSGGAYALSKYSGITPSAKFIAAKILFDNAGHYTRVLDGINQKRPLIAINVDNANQIERLKMRLKELRTLFDFGIEFNVMVLYKEKYNYYLHLTDLIGGAVRESGIENYIRGESLFRIFNYSQDENLYSEYLAAALKTDNLAVEILPAIDEILSNKKGKISFINESLPHKNAEMQPYDTVEQLGIGGFTKEFYYAMDLTDCDTPAPWSNIIATESFGTLVTESGGGYTFSANARESKISKWSNDAVEDKPSEYIAFEEKGLLWSASKKPIKTKSNYYALHGFGFSEFKNNYNGIITSQKVFIALNSDTKFYDINLINTVEKRVKDQTTLTMRDITVMFALNTVIGDFKINTSSSLKLARVNDYLFTVKNCVNGITVYVKCSQPVCSYSFYKEAYLNEGQIFTASELINKGSSPALALSVNIKLEDSARVIFSVGMDEDVNLDDADKLCNEAVSYYSNLSPVEMQGEDKLKYLLKWLPYQVLCSRFLGRTGFYQSSGAFGFRDQLQDLFTIMYINPKLARSHILECAAHQFEKGDVQHWWHVPSVGVRTRICDDRLFLPYLTAEYINFTHDFEIIAERVPYLEDINLSAHDASVYAAAKPTAHRASLLEHCIKAIDVSCDFSASGLMLMRGGDWNDAMDKVGENGNGTSVWCSMFLYFVIEKFLPLVNNKEVRARFTSVSENLREAVNKSFEGDRFTRAYTDSGQVLGSERSSECKIDLLSQSWATLSKITDNDRRLTALATASDKLVDRKNKMIKLLDPPFKEMKNIGYISNYPQGVRENGGQYTHAAVWFIMSYFMCNKNDEAYSLLKLINPIEHSLTKQESEKYTLEPYVLAADVYAGEFEGRGGWSWYTGSASWLYKCLVEDFLGIKITGKTIKFSPKLPESIGKLNIKLKTSEGVLDINYINGKKDNGWRLKIGEVTYNTDSVTLSAGLANKKITLIK